MAQNRKIEISERRRLAARYRSQGLGLDAVAQLLLERHGISSPTDENKPVANSTVAADVKHYLAQLSKEGALDIDERRAMSQRRIDMLRSAIAPKVMQGDASAGALWLKAENEENKLFGNYAPVQIEVQQRIQVEISTFIQVLEQRLPSDILEQVLTVVADFRRESQERLTIEAASQN